MCLKRKWSVFIMDELQEYHLPPPEWLDIMSLSFSFIITVHFCLKEYRKKTCNVPLWENISHIMHSWSYVRKKKKKSVKDVWCGSCNISLKTRMHLAKCVKTPTSALYFKRSIKIINQSIITNSLDETAYKSKLIEFS